MLIAYWLLIRFHSCKRLVDCHCRHDDIWWWHMMTYDDDADDVDRWTSRSRYVRTRTALIHYNRHNTSSPALVLHSARWKVVLQHTTSTTVLCYKTGRQRLISKWCLIGCQLIMMTMIVVQRTEPVISRVPAPGMIHHSTDRCPLARSLACQSLSLHSAHTDSTVYIA